MEQRATVLEKGFETLNGKTDRPLDAVARPFAWRTRSASSQSRASGPASAKPKTKAARTDPGSIETTLAIFTVKLDTKSAKMDLVLIETKLGTRDGRIVDLDLPSRSAGLTAAVALK